MNHMNNSIYTSQLMINLTAGLNVINQTLECVHRSPTGEEIIIGSAMIEITGYLIILSCISYMCGMDVMLVR